MDIKDKVVIITGASEGIGLATTLLLSSRGAKVVMAARSGEKLAEAAKELREVLTLAADMRSSQDIQTLFSQTMMHFGRIDVLINNAGQGLYSPIEHVDVDEYRIVMELNVFAVVEAMQHAIPIMREQGGGMIVNISSMTAKRIIPNIGAYASTKYALDAISLTAREELAKDKIIVGVVHPKMTATRFGINAIGGSSDDLFDNRQRAPGIDTANDVAEKILEIIESEEAEILM